MCVAYPRRKTCARPRSRPWLAELGWSTTPPVARKRCARLSEISWKHAARAHSWCGLARTLTPSLGCWRSGKESRCGRVFRSGESESLSEF
ncbi:unnamed protein product [Ectocarpus sp. 12 AP-2014]